MRTSSLALVGLFVVFGGLGGCGKKETPSTTTSGSGGGTPAMPGGGDSPDYKSAKACCDALMQAGTDPSDPEGSAVIQRAASACVVKAGDVLAGKATKADVLSEVKTTIGSGKLPSQCN